MPRVTVGEILEELGGHVGELPGVFSTPQWGGRAYKLPGPGGSRTKPKLLAFVVVADDRAAVSVSFKLSRERAEECIESCPGIDAHSFATLGRSGWLTARVSSRRHLATIKRLLDESRTLYPPAAPPAGETPGEDVRQTGKPSRSAEARRIDRVMEEARDKGWSPEPDDITKRSPNSPE